MSVFEGENNQNTENAEAGAEEGNQSYLKKLVEARGEQWSDPEVIAKGKLEADQYIEQLKRENEELKEKATKASTVDELLSEMRKKATDPATVNPSSEDNSGADESQTKTQVSEDQLQSLVESALTKREKENTTKQNVQQVEEHLAANYGEEAKSIVSKKAGELGLTSKRLGEIAAESPSAFFALIGEKTPDVKPMTQGSIRTESVNMQSRGERNSTYYSKLRKEEPRKFNSPQVQEQMLRDRIKLGDKFYN